MTTIVLADDHHVVREGLRALLESEPDFAVVGEAADGLEALQVVEKNAPDVLIVDLKMPAMDGLEVTRCVHMNCPRTRVIILSTHAAENYVVRALKNGALAYVLKSSTGAALIHAVHEVLQGRRYYSPPITQGAIDFYLQNAHHSVSDLLETLTGREREVMHWALQGLTNAEIADKLCVSVSTIASHRANLMQKLGLHSQTELIRYAFDRGILTVDK